MPSGCSPSSRPRRPTTSDHETASPVLGASRAASSTRRARSGCGSWLVVPQGRPRHQRVRRRHEQRGRHRASRTWVRTRSAQQRTQHGQRSSSLPVAARPPSWSGSWRTRAIRSGLRSDASHGSGRTGPDRSERGSSRRARSGRTSPASRPRSLRSARTVGVVGGASGGPRVAERVARVLAVAGGVGGGEPAGVREPPVPCDVGDVRHGGVGPQQLGADAIEADPPDVGVR